MGQPVPQYVLAAKPTDIDYALGNIPFGPHQPGTIRKFIYFAGTKFGWLWTFSYHPHKDHPHD